MALKHFHIVLIGCAVLLGAFFGIWSFSRFQFSGRGADLLTAGLSWLLSAILSAYLGWFLVKARRKGW